MYSVILLALLTLVLALALRRRLCETLPVALLTAAVLTYGFMVLGRKNLALLAVGGLVVVLCALALVLRRRQTATLAWKQLFGPGFVGLLAALAISWPMVSQLRFAILDDLIHWGLFTKQLCFLQSFPPAAQIATTYGDYPPGVQMLLVFLQIGQPFSQGLMFWGQLLWCFGFCLPLLAGLQWGGSWWKSLGRVVACAFVLLCLPALFNRYYAISLVVEPVMALLLGYALFAAWKARSGPRLFDAYAVTLALTVLALAKSTGILYAVFGAVAVLVLWLPAFKAMGWPARLACAGPVALPVAAWFSWSKLCEILGNTSYFSEDAPTAYTAENLRMFLTGEGLAGQVIPRFFKSLALQPLNKTFGLSALGLVAAVWLALWLVKKAGHDPGRSTLWAMGLLTGLFLIYCLSVCYSYVFLFDEEEALSLSAFTRYVGPLPAAMLLLALGPVSEALAGLGARPRGVVLGAGGLALALCAVGPLGCWLPGPYDEAATIVPKEMYLAQQEFAKAANAQLGQTPQKLLILSENGATDRHSQLRRYFLLPHQSLEVSPAQCGTPERAQAVWQEAVTVAGYGYAWALPGGEEAAQWVGVPLPETLPAEGLLWPVDTPPAQP